MVAKINYMLEESILRCHQKNETMDLIHFLDENTIEINLYSNIYFIFLVKNYVILQVLIYIQAELKKYIYYKVFLKFFRSKVFLKLETSFIYIL